MANKPFKQFERQIARLLGGVRFPANTGGPVDVTSETILASCKLRKTFGLNALAEEAERMEREARGTLKIGIVAVKPRRGSGRKSPVLIVMTAGEWARFHGSP